jgi:hypothetical protein
MSKSIVNIKYEKKFVFIMSQFIKWPTVQAVINNIVLFTCFCYISF